MSVNQSTLDKKLSLDLVNQFREFGTTEEVLATVIDYIVTMKDLNSYDGETLLTINELAYINDTKYGNDIIRNCVRLYHHNKFGRSKTHNNLPPEPHILDDNLVISIFMYGEDR